MGLGYSFSFIGFDWNPANNWMSVAVSVAILIGAVVFVEGWMIRKEGARSASPILEKSSRGMNAAVYLSKRLWMLPILVLVPGDVISTYAPYWPQITIGQKRSGWFIASCHWFYLKLTHIAGILYPVSKAVMVVGSVL
jgi:hypothetical protein